MGDHYLQLARTSTASSVSTNATAPNLPGPGRTVGLLLDRIGAHVETFTNMWARRLGLGPQAVAQEIRHLLRHDKLTIIERHRPQSINQSQFTDKENKALKKQSKKLLNYARFDS